ncbi:MAG: hypothetical protein AB2L12_01395 [Smithellaceae bacterium]
MGLKIHMEKKELKHSLKREFKNLILKMRWYELNYCRDLMILFLLSIKVVWDESKLIDEKGAKHGLIHSGIGY